MIFWNNILMYKSLFRRFGKFRVRILMKPVKFSHSIKGCDIYSLHFCFRKMRSLENPQENSCWSERRLNPLELKMCISRDQLLPTTFSFYLYDEDCCKTEVRTKSPEFEWNEKYKTVFKWFVSFLTIVLRFDFIDRLLAKLQRHPYVNLKMLETHFLYQK